MSVRFRSVTLEMEDIRLDEETVLKTAGANTALGFESLVFRLDEKNMVLWPSGEGNWLTSSRSTVRVCPGLLGEMSREVSAIVQATLRKSKNGFES